jgi:ribosomal protein S18 acetylase RimI-like enzyme
MRSLQKGYIMRITIRKILQGEERAFVELGNKCWKTAYRGIISEEYIAYRAEEQFEQRVEKFKEILKNPHYEMFFAEYNGEIIGCLFYGKSTDTEKPEAGEIAAIYLIEEFWDRGFGREMLDFALGELKRMSFEEVIIWVLEENRRARRFYERNGFALDGGKKEIEYGKPLTCLRYMKGKKQ